MQRYVSEWRQTITRIGRWVDFENDYKTMDTWFMESVWWAFKQLWDKGLIYQGMKVVPVSTELGTPLANFEATSNYKDVQDPAITVLLKIIDREEYLAVWTTTPWTLPGNVGLAVGPDVTYVRVKITAPPSDSWEGRGGAPLEEELILAKDLMSTVLRHQVEVVEEFPGSNLVGMSYQPLFEGAIDGSNHPAAWTIVGADFVTTTDGTGVVHTAVMYGEDDYNLGMKEGFPAQHTVGMDGRFVEGTHIQLDGRYVKDLSLIHI